MIRDRLIAWLLRSRALCRVGLHMPVIGQRFVGEKLVSDRRWECAACDKRLRRAR